VTVNVTAPPQLDPSILTLIPPCSLETKRTVFIEKGKGRKKTEEKRSRGAKRAKETKQRNKWRLLSGETIRRQKEEQGVVADAALRRLRRGDFEVEASPGYTFLLLKERKEGDGRKERGTDVIFL
jgi:hypothetical protein